MKKQPKTAQSINSKKMKNNFTIPLNPKPKFRMTQRSKHSPQAKSCLEYQQAVAGYARYLRVPEFDRERVEFGHLHFYRKGRPCDIDNLLKSFLDGLEYGHIFHNDNQVVAITALKVFYVKDEEDARIEFSIFKHLPDEPAN